MGKEDPCHEAPQGAALFAEQRRPRSCRRRGLASVYPGSHSSHGRRLGVVPILCSPLLKNGYRFCMKHMGTAHMGATSACSGGSKSMTYQAARTPKSCRRLQCSLPHESCCGISSLDGALVVSPCSCLVAGCLDISTLGLGRRSFCRSLP